MTDLTQLNHHDLRQAIDAMTENELRAVDRWTRKAQVAGDLVRRKLRIQRHKQVQPKDAGK
jgi:hypothetical protein